MFRGAGIAGLISIILRQACIRLRKITLMYRVWLIKEPFPGKTLLISRIAISLPVRWGIAGIRQSRNLFLSPMNCATKILYCSVRMACAA